MIFFIKIVSCIQKHLQINQLNIITLIKKDQKKAYDRYQSLSKEEKEQKKRCGCEPYKN